MVSVHLLLQRISYSYSFHINEIDLSVINYVTKIHCSGQSLKLSDQRLAPRNSITCSSSVTIKCALSREPNNTNSPPFCCAPTTPQHSLQHTNNNETTWDRFLVSQSLIHFTTRRNICFVGVLFIYIFIYQQQ